MPGELKNSSQWESSRTVSGLTQLVEVRFKGNRKEYFSADDSSINVGMSVVVEVERGQDLGEVTATGSIAEKKCGTGCSGCSKGAKKAGGSVVREASTHETHLITELRKAEDDIRRKVMERVASHKLQMKVSDAEWQWDRKKLTIYFTAEKRVDFRALVRDLAALFRTRIELRQIGARDEARRLDGLGRCGRQYCCSTWLDELKPVSLTLAKDQRLSLNPSQISGGCGRLLCCLRYEHDFYVTNRRRFPKEGKTVTTPIGVERVEAIDIFRERVLLKSPDGTQRSLSLVELRSEVGSVATKTGEAHPPSGLVTFDDGGVILSDEKAADVVVPTRRKRPRRRGRGRRNKPDDKKDNDPETED